VSRAMSKPMSCRTSPSGEDRNPVIPSRLALRCHGLRVNRCPSGHHRADSGGLWVMIDAGRAVVCFLGCPAGHRFIHSPPPPGVVAGGWGGEDIQTNVGVRSRTPIYRSGWSRNPPTPRNSPTPENRCSKIFSRIVFNVSAGFCCWPKKTPPDAENPGIRRRYDFSVSPMLCCQASGDDCFISCF